MEGLGESGGFLQIRGASHKGGTFWNVEIQISLFKIISEALFEKLKMLSIHSDFHEHSEWLKEVLGLDKGQVAASIPAYYNNSFICLFIQQIFIVHLLCASPWSIAVNKDDFEWSGSPGCGSQHFFAQESYGYSLSLPPTERCLCRFLFVFLL